MLLFMDIMVALELLVKQAHGFKASRSHKKRLERTMTDIIVLIPVTILMLLPVSTFYPFYFYLNFSCTCRFLLCGCNINYLFIDIIQNLAGLFWCIEKFD